MKLKGTMEVLMNHMEVLAELKAKNSNFRPISVVESFIVRDIEDLKVAVMTHAFDGLDFFANQGAYKDFDQVVLDHIVVGESVPSGVVTTRMLKSRVNTARLITLDSVRTAMIQLEADGKLIRLGNSWRKA